jgi:hypothetical protein
MTGLPLIVARTPVAREPFLAALRVETARLRLRASVLTVGDRLMGRPHVAADVVVLEIIEVVAAVRVIAVLAIAEPHAAVHRLAAGVPILLAERHDDAVIVLGVLQVVLGENGIAGRGCVTCERHVFFADMRRSSADFHVRPIAFVAARERTLALAVMVIVIAPATSAILLSLPHGLRSQLSI